MMLEKLTVIILSIAVVLVFMYGENFIKEEEGHAVRVFQKAERKVETKKVQQVDPTVIGASSEFGEPLSLYASELMQMIQTNKRIQFVDCDREWNPICMKSMLEKK